MHDTRGSRHVISVSLTRCISQHSLCTTYGDSHAGINQTCEMSLEERVWWNRYNGNGMSVVHKHLVKPAMQRREQKIIQKAKYATTLRKDAEDVTARHQVSP